MSDKQYTLIRKNSVTGPDYVYNRGDVVSQKQYDALIPRHKDQFVIGVVDPFKRSTKKDTVQDATLADLTARVEALEAKIGLSEPDQEPNQEPEKPADQPDEKPAKKASK